MSLAQPQRQMWVRMMTGRSAGRRRISPGTRCDSVCAPTLDAPIATTACDDERSVSASWLERTDRGRATLSSEIRGASVGRVCQAQRRNLARQPPPSPHQRRPAKAALRTHLGAPERIDLCCPLASPSLTPRLCLGMPLAPAAERNGRRLRRPRGQFLASGGAAKRGAARQPNARHERRR